MIFSVIAAILVGIGIALLMGFTPETVTRDLMDLLTPRDSLREMSAQSRGKKKKHRLYSYLVRFQGILEGSGKSKQFYGACAGALLGIAAGVVLAIVIDNLLLMPVLSAAFAIAPFFYITRALALFERNSKLELETTLNLITASYVRTEDIISAVAENLPFIRNPLYGTFRGFYAEATAITVSIKTAISHMRDKVDDDIFHEWCDILILCQDDRTLKDMLQPTVTKLTDMRIINNELQTILFSAKLEYWTMVALTVGSIPLMYFFNEEWLDILLHTLPGRIVIAICATVLLITFLLVEKYARPIKFRR